MNTLTLSVVIVSYRRSADLERCLASLARQIDRPNYINIIYRSDDLDTVRLLKRLMERSGSFLRAHSVEEPGVVAARNRGIDTTSTDIMAMIDDDTEAPSEWAGKIRDHFAGIPELGALGGRDLLYVDGFLVEGKRKTVGKLQWFGRAIGNHHLGYGVARPVDFLKGANMAFRTTAVKNLHFNRLLRGDGAQPSEDMEFSLSVKKRGWLVLYDPNLVIRHNQAPRAEARHYASFTPLDGRERYNFEAFCFNEVIAIWPSLSLIGKISYVIFSVVLGTCLTPGALQTMRLMKTLRLSAIDRFFVCQTGKAKALLALHGFHFRWNRTSPANPRNISFSEEN